MTDSKICKSCQIDKSFFEYCINRKGKYGLASKCSTCQKELNKQYYIQRKVAMQMLKENIIHEEKVDKKYDFIEEI